jgi:importin subunit alpha-6/7
LKTKKSQVQRRDENNDSIPVSTIQTSKKATVDDIPRLAEIIMGNYSGNDKAEATKQIRRLVSKERHPPVCKVLQSGVLPSLVFNLTVDLQNQSLIFESAWALTNIASSEYGSYVAKAGAVPPLVQLMAHVSPDVREQSMWCLGNIAGEGVETRDMVLSHDPIQNL